MTTTEKIIAYFEENDDRFIECIEELDGRNGYLSDDRYYSMDMLAEFYHDCDPIELLQRAYFGHDEDSWHTDANGNKEYGAFNPNRDYFKYNGYGNLVSTDFKDYTAHLDKWFVEALAENRTHLDYIPEEIVELLDELEQEEA